MLKEYKVYKEIIDKSKSFGLTFSNSPYQVVFTDRFYNNVKYKVIHAVDCLDLKYDDASEIQRLSLEDLVGIDKALECSQARCIISFETETSKPVTITKIFSYLENFNDLIESKTLLENETPGELSFQECLNFFKNYLKIYLTTNYINNINLITTKQLKVSLSNCQEFFDTGLTDEICFKAVVAWLYSKNNFSEKFINYNGAKLLKSHANNECLISFMNYPGEELTELVKLPGDCLQNWLTLKDLLIFKLFSKYNSKNEETFIAPEIISYIFEDGDSDENFTYDGEDYVFETVNTSEKITDEVKEIVNSLYTWEERFQNHLKKANYHDKDYITKYNDLFEAYEEAKLLASN